MDIDTIKNKMKSYTTTKEIRAVPMTLGEYTKLRGWEVASKKSANDKGFLVEFLDGRINFSGFKGFVSWTPEELFNEYYTEVEPEDVKV